MVICYYRMVTFLLLILCLPLHDLSASELEIDDWTENDNFEEYVRQLELQIQDSTDINGITLLSDPRYDTEILRLFLKSESNTILRDSILTLIRQEQYENESLNKSNYVRVSLQSGQYYGADADSEEQQYDGSPLKMKQRYAIKYKNLDSRIIFDKAAYEPSAVDLNRFFVRMRMRQAVFIAGDFHFSSGSGLCLWTNPVFIDAYDAHTPFRRQGQGISPATDTRQNSALRGFACQVNQEGVKFDLSISKTPLDAIVDDISEDRIRLSSTGLHRTGGESSKKNSINESTFCSMLRVEQEHSFFGKAVYHINGYLSEFDHPLNPGDDQRTRFALSGKRAGSLGGGFRTLNPEYSLQGEVCWDLRGNTAWSAGGSWFPEGSADFSLDARLWHVPLQYYNHRSIPYSKNPTTYGRNCAAILLKGRPELLWLSSWQLHFDIEEQSWRSYTVPQPAQKRRLSLAGLIPLTQKSSLQIRFRRYFTQDGHGEEKVADEITENRLRLTYKLMNANKDENPLKIVGEFLCQQENRIDERYAGLIDVRVNKLYRPYGKSWGILESFASISLFNCETGTSCYLGENGIPGQIRSVRLTERGFRLNSGLAWHAASGSHLAMQCSRSLYLADNNGNWSDLEANLSFSWCFQY